MQTHCCGSFLSRNLFQPVLMTNRLCNGDISLANPPPKKKNQKSGCGCTEELSFHFHHSLFYRCNFWTRASVHNAVIKKLSNMDDLFFFSLTLKNKYNTINPAQMTQDRSRLAFIIPSVSSSTKPRRKGGEQTPRSELYLSTPL